MTIPKASRVSAVALVLSLAAVAHGQEWRGMGRVAGHIVDENGAPIEDVTVKAMLPAAGNRGPTVKSNRKGEWTVAGVARGEWAIDFVKEGYESKNISVSISESTRIPPIDVTMKKTAPAVDATAAIKEKLTEAAAHVSAKRFAEARAIYTDLSTRYPDVAQFDPLIARTYHAEGNRAKAIEHLRAGLAKDPANVEVKLLLGNTLIENGQTEEGQKMLTSVDDSKVTDPAVYLNVGIAMINQGRHADAVTWFERALARFPEHPDAYYYRGIARVSLGKPAEAKADLEKFVAMAPPDAPELPTAKKVLDGLK